MHWTSGAILYPFCSCLFARSAVPTLAGLVLPCCVVVAYLGLLHGTSLNRRLRDALLMITIEAAGLSSQADWFSKSLSGSFPLRPFDPAKHGSLTSK